MLRAWVADLLMEVLKPAARWYLGFAICLILAGYGMKDGWVRGHQVPLETGWLFIIVGGSMLIGTIIHHFYRWRLKKH